MNKMITINQLLSSSSLSCRPATIAAAAVTAVVVSSVTIGSVQEKSP